MAVDVGSRNKLKNKLKGRTKATKDDFQSLNTRKKETRQNGQEKCSRIDDTDSSPGPYKREGSRRMNSSKPDKQFLLDQEGSRRDAYGKKLVGSTNSSQKRKRKSGRLDLEERMSNYDHYIEEKGSKREYREENNVRASKSQYAELSVRKSSSLRGGKSPKDVSVKESKKLHKSRVYNEGNDELHNNKHPSRLKGWTKGAGTSDDKVRSKAKATAATTAGRTSSKVLAVSSKDGSVQKSVKSKLNLKKNADQRDKKKASRKVGPDNDSVVTDHPRRRKRVIRIDPHDISNKRLDDGISMNEKVVEKNLEQRKETSKNAQFRAIQPSPAILSFVEDNLLGRRRLIELRRSGYNIELSSPLDNMPFSTSPEREKIEENVFRNKLTFFAAAKVSSSFPPPDIPEIAFAGRSNVGKSSLLNSLTRQWGVVRTSDKPGLTQTINFFNLATKLFLVDLPGYGFAYAKDEVKDAWEELVKEYVSTRVGLQRVCLLIDTKWGMKPRDHELIDLMERSQTKYQIVLTKTDMVFPINVARRAMQIQEILKTNKSVVNPVMMVSSKSGAGIRSLRSVLAKVVRFAK